MNSNGGSECYSISVSQTRPSLPSPRKHDHLRNPLVVPKRKPIAVLNISIGIGSPTIYEKGKLLAKRWVERA